MSIPPAGRLPRRPGEGHRREAAAPRRGWTPPFDRIEAIEIADTDGITVLPGTLDALRRSRCRPHDAATGRGRPVRDRHLVHPSAGGREDRGDRAARARASSSPRATCAGASPTPTRSCSQRSGSGSTRASAWWWRTRRVGSRQRGPRGAPPLPSPRPPSRPTSSPTPWWRRWVTSGSAWSRDAFA